MRKTTIDTNKTTGDLSLSALERIELLGNIIIEIIDDEQTKPKAECYAEPNGK
jgi:hypothetical protein